MTGMALEHCILSKFLRIVCHCFPPPLDVPTFAARCLYVRNDARDPSSEKWNCGREICPGNFYLNSDFHLNLGIFYMPQIYDMGPTALLPLRRKACCGFFRPKNPKPSAGFEPAKLGTKGQQHIYIYIHHTHTHNLGFVEALSENVLFYVSYSSRLVTFNITTLDF